MYRYIIIGGIPITMYNGSGSFTGLKVVGKSNSKLIIQSIIKERWDECGGLMVIIDTTTGDIANV